VLLYFRLGRRTTDSRGLDLGPATRVSGRRDNKLSVRVTNEERVVPEVFRDGPGTPPTVWSNAESSGGSVPMPAKRTQPARASVSSSSTIPHHRSLDDGPIRPIGLEFYEPQRPVRRRTRSRSPHGEPMPHPLDSSGVAVVASPQVGSPQSQPSSPSSPRSPPQASPKAPLHLALPVADTSRMTSQQLVLIQGLVDRGVAGDAITSVIRQMLGDGGSSSPTPSERSNGNAHDPQVPSGHRPPEQRSELPPTYDV